VAPRWQPAARVDLVLCRQFVGRPITFECRLRILFSFMRAKTRAARAACPALVGRGSRGNLRDRLLPEQRSDSPGDLTSAFRTVSGYGGSFPPRPERTARGKPLGLRRSPTWDGRRGWVTGPDTVNPEPRHSCRSREPVRRRGRADAPSLRGVSSGRSF